MLKEANAPSVSNLGDFIIGTFDTISHLDRIKSLRAVISGEEQTAQLWGELGFPEYAAMSRNKADAAREELTSLNAEMEG